jgi:membrane protein YdbS with pleckstrin-like domain
MRIFNLATIEIFTAGGSMSDLKISGLKKEEAEKMKAFITNKITDEADFEAEESDFLTQNSSIDAPQEQS